MIYPFLDASLYHRVIRGLLNGLILASAAFAIGRSLRVLVIAVLLAGPAIAMQASVIANGEEGMVELWYMASAMFYAFTVAQVLAYVLRQGAVSSEKSVPRSAPTCCHLRVHRRDCSGIFCNRRG